MDQGVILQRLIMECKNKLGIEKVRYIGDLAQPCSNVLLMVGAAGGKSADHPPSGPISRMFWCAAKYQNGKPPNMCATRKVKGVNCRSLYWATLPARRPGRNLC